MQDFKPGTRTFYLFILKTDGYAGNFQRELTLYLTGYAGACPHRELRDFVKQDFEKLGCEYDYLEATFNDTIEQFETEYGLEWSIILQAKDGGDWHTCLMFNERPSPELVEFLCERAKKYPEVEKELCFRRSSSFTKITGYEIREVKTQIAVIESK